MNVPIDRIDFEIIELLQKNARLSNKELAAAVGLAASSCLARVQRLRAEGVLLGYHAEVALEALGIGLQAMVAVRLRQHSRTQLKAFWKHLRSMKEVRAAYHVTGAYDFLVHVVARDMEHLRDLALDAFTSRAEVAHLETSLIFEHHDNPVAPRLSAPEPIPAKKGR